ncbi:hypothetical protein HHI36_012814 [Cryptolaemus montrouzieri]|uniref:Uncharacterized protein n=1 Tax=Cryptolaemus montrouzieri TaxID=559131 RepID=A0ABD2NFB8_9CUCU
MKFLVFSLCLLLTFVLLDCQEEKVVRKRSIVIPKETAANVAATLKTTADGIKQKNDQFFMKIKDFEKLFDKWTNKSIDGLASLTNSMIMVL